ncbi:RNA polymerase sigma factor (sigma-70 family) [Promicromonospora sp. AC04]|uniref:sigma-70 family RNA polymerase sigma factor n=1 Tax=Promicromonospora sp. AC04 TaxID=2135723 RepID=UPI000D441E90|nr:sigma-70 family RNA polymerase sigma factor [Promicromonospora sp. AC04]PUB21517.1 RNA polymerase sigma factor (sigma-70 family) [Promicromonospora sp. AC04]
MRTTRNPRSPRGRRGKEPSPHPALPQSYAAMIERTPSLDDAQLESLLERAVAGADAARTLNATAVSPTLRTQLEARVKDGQYAKERLVLAHLRLVPAIASSYSGRLPFMDLVQEGNVGLVRAADSYDPAHGTFAAYAHRWVRRSIVRAVAAADQAENAGPSGPTPEQTMLRRRVRQALRHLDAVEARVLELRFGLVDGTTRTLDEISRRLGVTKERVAQILETALARLRDVVSPAPLAA